MTFPDPEMEPASVTSNLRWQVGFFLPLVPPGKPCSSSSCLNKKSTTYEHYLGILEGIPWIRLMVTEESLLNSNRIQVDSYQ